MSDRGQTGGLPRAVRTAHGELTLEQIADALPSTGDLMALVGGSWWKCAYAARGGNWPLAAYFARRVRSLQRKLGVLRPKHRERLAAFETEQLAPLFRAIEAADLPSFERAFAAATASANQSHVETGYAYIRWVLPAEPPRDLDLGRPDQGRPDQGRLDQGRPDQDRSAGRPGEDRSGAGSSQP